MIQFGIVSRRKEEDKLETRKILENYSSRNKTETNMEEKNLDIIETYKVGYTV